LAVGAWWLVKRPATGNQPLPPAIKPQTRAAPCVIRLWYAH